MRSAIEAPAKPDLVVGRQPEKARIEALIKAVGAGEKRATVLLGDPGIGKTTLLRWAHQRGTESGMTCALVRAPATAGLPPNFPVTELLDQVRATLGPVSGETRAVDRALEGLRGELSPETPLLPLFVEALESLTPRRPIGLFIDDAQWVPEAGTSLLLAGLRVLEAPLLFMATQRPDDSGHDYGLLAHAGGDLWIDYIELSGLTNEDVDHLTAHLLGRPLLPSTVATLNSQSGGNPLFVAEIVRAWRQEENLASVGRRWLVAKDADQQSTLEQYVRGRISQLPQHMRGLLELLATLGRDASLEELRAVTQYDTDTLVGIIFALTTSGLVSEDLAGGDAKYRLAHSLYESAVRETLGNTMRRHLHSKVFRGLKRAQDLGIEATVSELAYHGFLALEPPVDLSDLMAQAATTASSAGSYRESAMWYGRLAQRAKDAVTRSTALIGQAAATTHFEPRFSVALATEVLALEEGHIDVVSALIERARAFRILGQLDEAIADLSQALAECPPDRVLEVEHARATLFALRGDVELGESILMRLAGGELGPTTSPMIVGHLGSFAFARSQLVRAHALWEEALSRCADHDYAIFLRHNLSWACALLGDWPSAEKLLVKGIHDADSRGDAWNLVALLAASARLSAWKGDSTAAADAAWRAARLAPRLENPGCQIDALDALGVALVEDGQASDGVRFLDEAMRLIDSASESREFCFTLAVLAEALTQSDSLTRATIVLAEAYDHLSSAQFWEIYLRRVDARIAARQSQLDRSREILERWVEEPSVLEYENIRVLEFYARVLHATGSVTQALQYATEAADRFDRLGAPLRAAELRTWRDQRHPRRRGRPRSDGPDGLTMRELEVLQLLASGMSNRDIARELVISLSTAKKHVEHLLMKLAASNRAELVSIGRARGLV